MYLQFGRSRIRYGTAAGVVLGIAILLASPCLAQTVHSATAGTIRGAVTDSSGSSVAGAIVRLQPEGSAATRTTITDQAGAFDFVMVEPGTYTLTITDLGFTERQVHVSVVAGENPPLPVTVLEVAAAASKVDVTLAPHELAAEQLHAEVKQRMLGVFPNFFVSYDPNAAPLTAAQKFQLGWAQIIDPVVLVGTGIGAGYEQWRNHYPEFGQGVEGYAKRFGAGYADRASGVFIGHIITQSVFHQDPRYFYKGTGTIRARALYAIGTAFVRKGDNGRWQPDYSDVVGDLASGEISTLYYPASSRTGLRLFHGVLLGFGARAVNHLAQEFVYRKLTTHVPKMAASTPPVLREGTALSLISIEDLRSIVPQNATPIHFVLARDIDVNGVLVAPAGSKATGEVTCTPVPSASAGVAPEVHLSLQNVLLQVGKRELPLRGTAQKNGGGALVYHWLEDTGRIEVVLYLAQNVTLPAAE